MNTVVCTEWNKTVLMVCRRVNIARSSASSVCVLVDSCRASLYNVVKAPCVQSPSAVPATGHRTFATSHLTMPGVELVSLLILNGETPSLLIIQPAAVKLPYEVLGSGEPKPQGSGTSRTFRVPSYSESAVPGPFGNIGII